MKRATPCEKSNSNRRRGAVPSEKKNKRNQQMIQRTLRTGSEFYERTCPVLKKEMYAFEPVLIIDSRSCENRRSVFSPVLTLKSVNQLILIVRTGLRTGSRIESTFENHPTTLVITNYIFIFQQIEKMIIFFLIIHKMDRE